MCIALEKSIPNGHLALKIPIRKSLFRCDKVMHNDYQLSIEPTE